MARGLYGCLPNDPSRPRVTLKPLPDAELSPPQSVDWFSKVPSSSWGMLGNGPDNSYSQGYQGCGDCTCASAGHIVDLVAWFAQNQPAPVTAKQVVSLYSAISGYDPRSGNNDNGAELQQALQGWAKQGLAGYSPTGFAQIDYSNVALVKSCVQFFGSVYAALNVPSTAEQQFDQGQPWDVTNRRPQIVGGHAVPIIGYDQTYLYVLTWAAVQKVTWRFYSQFFNESWIAVLPQWMEASGSTPSGLNTAAANQEYQQLTGSSASPFPNVTPTPTPTPSSDAVTLLQNVKTALDGQSAAIDAFLQSPHVHGH